MNAPMNDSALATLGEITKPATVLIEKISEAIGSLYKPIQIVRIAKAEAKAELICTEAQIEAANLRRRATRRFIAEEAKKQANIEEITRKALPQLAQNSNPQAVEDDWITNFFEKCRIVSNQQMQQLWSRILAGEANRPGAFSKRTVNLLADLDMRDAALFTRLCGFCWTILDIQPLIFDLEHTIYTGAGINFGGMGHLESLGLVKFSDFAGFARMRLPKMCSISYYGRRLTLTLPADANYRLDIGRVLLTQAGHELAPVCGSTPVNGFFEYVYDKWAAQSLVPKRAAPPGNLASGVPI